MARENEKSITCKQCAFWRNGQSLLQFMNHTGMCMNPKLGYTVEEGIMIGVLDTDNAENGFGNPVQEFNNHESIKRADKRKYYMATSENFGCLFGESATN